MDVQWYPGHMTKARRAMEENIKLIDVIIELVDARLPLSSRNPDIDKMGRNKFRLILMNKSDLADEAANDRWERYFISQGYAVVRLDARSKNRMKQVQNKIAEVSREKTERDRKRGILNRPVRCMVCGIPNVGKSTFINSFCGKASAKTGNKPGVTRGNQWIRLNKGIELLDTPGILWPKFEDPEVGMRLAIAGSVSDNILNRTELAIFGLDYMKAHYPANLAARYEGVDFTRESWQNLEDIAKLRGAIVKGGEADSEKAAKLVLEDFRSGRLGRITLEEAPRPAEDETETSKEAAAAEGGEA